MFRTANETWYTDTNGFWVCQHNHIVVSINRLYPTEQLVAMFTVLPLLVNSRDRLTGSYLLHSINSYSASRDN